MKLCFSHEMVLKSSANREKAHRTATSLRKRKHGGPADKSDNSRRIVEQC